MGTAHIESGQARSSVAHRRDSGACVRLLDGFDVREGRYVFDLPANTSRHGDPRSPRRTAAPRLRSRRLVAGQCRRAGRCKLALGVVEAPSLGTHLVQASRALEQLSDRLAAAGRSPRAAGLCGHYCNSRRLDVIQYKDSPFRVGRDRGGRRVIHSADPPGNDHAREEVR